MDEVMEKETYKVAKHNKKNTIKKNKKNKVAKQILDKFAPSRLVTPPRPLGQPSLRYIIL